jgi:aspartate-semialdehyde dehydrogenase
MCNRVAVVDGHTECVSIKLRKPATHAEILAAWAEFQPLHGKGLDGLHLPSAPFAPWSTRPKRRVRSRATT